MRTSKQLCSLSNHHRTLTCQHLALTPSKLSLPLYHKPMLRQVEQETRLFWLTRISLNRTGHNKCSRSSSSQHNRTILTSLVTRKDSKWLKLSRSNQFSASCSPNLNLRPNNSSLSNHQTSCQTTSLETEGLMICLRILRTTSILSSSLEILNSSISSWALTSSY